MEKRRPGGRRLRLAGAPPRIVALEGLIEAENVGEIQARVRGLTDQKTHLDECEHDVADIGGRSNAPVVENQARHDAVAIERKISARFGELASRNVSPLGEPRLRELESR